MNDLSFSPERGYVVVAGEPGAAGAPTESLLNQYLRTVLRWKWLVLGSILAALLIGLLVTLMATPLYTATTRIEVKREGSRVVDFEGAEAASKASDTEFYQTQYGILSSRSLAERVVRDLRLENKPEFFTAFGRDDIISDDGKVDTAQDERVRIAADLLLKSVEVKPIRMSRLVDISVTSPDPALSTTIANAWAGSFIEYNLERKFESTSYARRFLEQKLAELRSRLEDSERQLVSYASNQAIINIPVATSGEGQAQERSLTADSLAALNTALAEATAARMQAQGRLQQTSGGALPEELVNPAITGLRQRKAVAEAEYARLLTQFETGYPTVQAVAAQVRQLDESIRREESRVRSSLRTGYSEAVARERAISGEVENLKQNFLDQRRRSIQYNIHLRDADTNRQLYDGLLQRYKEIGVAGGIGENNVAVVDRARMPRGPSHPRPIINLLIATFAGIIVGLGLAFIREQMNETIRDPSELETMVGLPLLGAVPKSETDPVKELADPKSHLIEAYLSVQTNLSFSTDHGVPRSLAVTSTRPSEGKSTTAFALAYIISRTGSKVVLLDGDMRAPSAHGDLGVDNEFGLANYLAGAGDVDTLIKAPAAVPFHVITAGPQPPNAAELLRSGKLDTLIAELLARYDHVVIDSPPVMGLADAPIIASKTEGTVFVAEAHGVKARLIRLAIGRLRQGHARLLGTVLTKFETKRSRFGYEYGYGYGYGYGVEEPTKG